MREGFVGTDAGRLWTAAYGEGAKGTPVLVMHGGPGFLSMTETVRDLADERPVYFYDQLGCGRSDRAADNRGYSPERYVAELDVVRRALGLPEVVLMGFSWGAMLTCLYMLERPRTGIRGLVLCGPYLSTPRWDADQRAHLARLPAAEREAIEAGERTRDYGPAYQAATMAFYRRHLCCLDPWPDFVTQAVTQLNMDVYLPLWGPSEFTITGTLKNHDLAPRLAEIDVPVLLTCGDRDEAAPATVQQFQRAFPNAAMCVLPNAAHLHQIEQPALFLAAVRGFLAGIERPR
jgi:proline iminopeptidase